MTNPGREGAELVAAMGAPRLVTRRRFLAASAAGAAALAADAAWIEPNLVRVTRHVLGEPAAGRPPLVLAQLSDLHLREVGGHEERIAEAVHAGRPDVVVLTGDAIDRAGALPALRDFLGLLPRAARRYAILGNWEHWARLDLAALGRLYAAYGMELLVDRTASLEHHGARVLLTGLDDATGGHPRPRAAVAGVEPSANHLLMAHSPAQRDALRGALGPHAPGYMLSGHTHGGQVAILGRAPWRPRGSGRYLRGWYRDALPHLYVSRGLGTSVLPVRLGSPPEVAVFVWHLAG